MTSGPSGPHFGALKLAADHAGGIIGGVEIHIISARIGEYAVDCGEARPHSWQRLALIA